MYIEFSIEKKHEKEQCECQPWDLELGTWNLFLERPSDLNMHGSSIRCGQSLTNMHARQQTDLTWNKDVGDKAAAHHIHNTVSYSP